MPTYVAEAQTTRLTPWGRLRMLLSSQRQKIKGRRGRFWKPTNQLKAYFYQEPLPSRQLEPAMPGYSGVTPSRQLLWHWR